MSRRRFEYLIIEGGKGGLMGAKHRQASMDILNQHGREGWECYHAKTDSYPTVFYLKREIG